MKCIGKRHEQIEAIFCVVVLEFARQCFPATGARFDTIIGSIE